MKMILLTGASGFIGSHVLEQMVAQGLPVRILARSGSDVALARSLGVEIRQGDVRDVESLCEAVKGCEQVVHTAARVCDWGTWNDFRETNVEGTLNVLQASKLRGVSHVIVTGSISSYGEENCATPKDEHAPFNPRYPYCLHRVFPSALNFYRESKAEATEKALEFGRKHDLPVTLLEPVWVYGEREFNTGFYSYVKAVQKGCRWMPGSPANTFQVIYARDLASAYVLAVRRRLPGVERMIIGNPAPVSMYQLFGLFCSEAGFGIPRLLSRWTVYPVGFAMELAWTLTAAHSPPPLTRGRVNTFYDSIRYSAEKAKNLLGFEAPTSLEQGVRATVQWYKANHYL